jgi:hypothetical protein
MGLGHLVYRVIMNFQTLNCTVCALKYFLIGLAALLWLGSCTRIDNTQQVANYTFTNSMHVPLRMDLYPSMEDYNNNRNLLQSYQLESGATLSMPLEVGKVYGIDWYSEGYRYSNWVNRSFFGGGATPTVHTLPYLGAAESGGQLSLSTDGEDTSRSILLNGSGTSSTWEARIDDASKYKGRHTFVFGKDFRCSYTLVTDKTQYRQLTYGVQRAQSQTFAVMLLDENRTAFATMFFEHPLYSSRASRDTLRMTFFDDPATRYYDVARQ